MSFLNPAGLWLLLGVPVLILIYLIRSQHEDHPVSSTFIWKLSSRFMKKRLPMQKIKKILAFVLQFAIVVGVALLAARPAVPNGKCVDYVAIIDTSASMQTTDEEGVTRFQRALEQVEALTNEIENGHTVSVLLAGNEASWMVQKCTSANEVKLALNNARCTFGSCDTAKALELAQELCQTSKNAQVLFFTDNEYGATRNIQVVNLSNGEWNVAVTGVTAVEAGKGVEFSANVVSYHRDATVTVGLRIDGAVVDAQIVECVQNTTSEVTFQVENLQHFDTAEVFVETKDALPEDNSYVRCQTAQREHKVLLCSPTPLYLSSALDALGTCNTTVVASPDEVELVGYDLYIFDFVSPVTYPEDGSVIVLGTQRLPSGLATGSMIDVPGELTVDHQLQTPLYDGVHFKETVVTNYFALTGSVAWTNFLYCDENVVAVTRQMGKGLHFTVLSFDLHETNLALQFSTYLTFMANLVEYSVPEILKDTDHVSGSIVDMTVLPGTEQMHVVMPDDSIKSLSVAGSSVSLPVEKVGVYTAVVTNAEGGEYVDFFVHIPEGESGTLLIPEISLEVSYEMVEQAEDATSEIWFWLALAMLVVVLAEWGWYYHEQY